MPLWLTYTHLLSPLDFSRVSTHSLFLSLSPTHAINPYYFIFLPLAAESAQPKKAEKSAVFWTIIRHTAEHTRFISNSFSNNPLSSVLLSHSHTLSFRRLNRALELVFCLFIFKYFILHKLITRAHQKLSHNRSISLSHTHSLSRFRALTRTTKASRLSLFFLSEISIP